MFRNSFRCVFWLTVLKTTAIMLTAYGALMKREGPRQPTGGREGHLQLTDEEPEAPRAPARAGSGTGDRREQQSRGKPEHRSVPTTGATGAPRASRGSPAPPCPRQGDRAPGRLARLRAAVPPPSEAGRATGRPPPLAPAPGGPGSRSVSSAPGLRCFLPPFLLSSSREKFDIFISLGKQAFGAAFVCLTSCLSEYSYYLFS